MLDKYGREINYARISITDLCNLRCLYCMPQDGVKKKDYSEIMRLEQIVFLAETLVELGFTKIRLTGGEPLIRKGFTHLCDKIGNLEGLKDFSVTTNGVLLSKYIQQLKNCGIRINISLDTLDKDKYRSITNGGNINDVLNGVKAANENGFKIKINTVLINGFNTAEIEDFAKLTIDNAIDVRFIELMTIGERSDWTQGKYISSQIILDTLKTLTPCESNDISSAAVYYKLPDAKGKIGLIRPISGKFCGDCNRIRFTADGKIKPCLHNDDEVGIMDKLNDKELLKQAIVQAVEKKPYCHELSNGKFTERNMVRIGG